MGALVPESYHPFFEASAGVAGALIGLLFVAISVAPERLQDEDAGFRIGAGIAFAALTNCLFVTLVALLPNGQLKGAGTYFSIAGLVSTAWLAWSSVRQPGMPRRFRALIRVAALAALFAAQLVTLASLRTRGQDTGSIETLTYLVLIGFGIAIDRSWELVGGSGTNLVAAIERLAKASRDAGSSAPADAEADAEPGPAPPDDGA